MFLYSFHTCEFLLWNKKGDTSIISSLWECTFFISKLENVTLGSDMAQSWQTYSSLTFCFYHLNCEKLNWPCSREMFRGSNKQSKTSGARTDSV